MEPLKDQAVTIVLSCVVIMGAVIACIVYALRSLAKKGNTGAATASGLGLTLKVVFAAACVLGALVLFKTHREDRQISERRAVMQEQRRVLE